MKRRKKRYLSEETATTELLDQLVTGKSNRNRHHSSRAISLDDIRGIGLSGGVTVAVVEDGVVGLVDPLPQDDVEGLAIKNEMCKNTVAGANNIPH